MINFYNAIAGASSPEPKGKAKVVLMTGQSGLQGRGDNTDLTELQLLPKSNDFIFSHSSGSQAGYLGNESGFSIESLHLGVNNKPVYQNNPDEHGVEAFLGDAVRSIYPNSNVYFLKYARGGTAISAWTNGGFMYAGMLPYFNSGLSAIPEQYDIEFLYWDQGENNTFNAAINTTAYQTDCLSLFSDFRSDIDSGLKIVSRQLSSNQVAYGMNDLNSIKSQQLFVSNQSSLNYLINSDDLNFPDTMHTNSEGLSLISDRIISTVN